jgi:hypothetical protein
MDDDDSVREIIEFIRSVEYPFGSIEINASLTDFRIVEAALLRDYEHNTDDFLRMLISNGFSTRLQDSNGNTVLHLLARRINYLIDQREYVLELIGLRLEDRDLYNELSDKINALISGSDALVRYGAKPFEKNEFEETPLSINGNILQSLQKYNRWYAAAVQDKNDLGKVMSTTGKKLFEMLQ